MKRGEEKFDRRKKVGLMSPRLLDLSADKKHIMVTLHVALHSGASLESSTRDCSHRNVWC